MAGKNDTPARQRWRRRILWLACTSVALFSFIQIGLLQRVAAQTSAGQTARPRSSRFQGNWEGGTYVQDKSQAPVGVNTRKQPANQVSLTLVQTGATLSGEYGASIGWGRRFETGEFNAKLVGNTTTITLESGWGGQVTVSLTLQENRLDWRVSKATGENYFPTRITLRRVK